LRFNIFHIFKIYKKLFEDTFSKIDIETFPLDKFRNIDIKSLFDDVKKNEINYKVFSSDNKITEEDLYRILSVFTPFKDSEASNITEKYEMRRLCLNISHTLNYYFILWLKQILKDDNLIEEYIYPYNLFRQNDCSDLNLVSIQDIKSFSDSKVLHKRKYNKKIPKIFYSTEEELLKRLQEIYKELIAKIFGIKTNYILFFHLFNFDSDYINKELLLSDLELIYTGQTKITSFNIKNINKFLKKEFSYEYLTRFSLNLLLTIRYIDVYYSGRQSNEYYMATKFNILMDSLKNKDKKDDNQDTYSKICLFLLNYLNFYFLLWIKYILKNHIDDIDHIINYYYNGTFKIGLLPVADIYDFGYIDVTYDYKYFVKKYEYHYSNKEDLLIGLASLYKNLFYNLFYNRKKSYDEIKSSIEFEIEDFLSKIDIICSQHISSSITLDDIYRILCIYDETIIHDNNICINRRLDTTTSVSERKKIFEETSHYINIYFLLDL